MWRVFSNFVVKMQIMEYTFDKLEVYQKARKLVKSVYLLIKNFPNEEKFALCDQIRRAVISVPSNIAEGCGRMSIKERIHFIEISYGSLMELYCQIQLACDLEYISEEQFTKISQDIEEVAKMLSGFRKSMLSRI